MQRKACAFYRLCANELTQKAILIRGAKNLLNAIDFPKTNYSYVIGKSTESFTLSSWSVKDLKHLSSRSQKTSPTIGSAVRVSLCD